MLPDRLRGAISPRANDMETLRNLSDNTNDQTKKRDSQNMNIKFFACPAAECYDYYKSDPSARFLSWEHCYNAFHEARAQKSPDLDYLSLQLAFYLASWGMYRGSSFLLQKDYTVHKNAVQVILESKYNSLDGINCIDYKTASNINLLFKELVPQLEEHYENVRKTLPKYQSAQTGISTTLITKILMGTLACVPAYDRYFVSGIKSSGVATGSFNCASLDKIVKHYIRNSKLFETERKHMTTGICSYPQMKLVDMEFWTIGFKSAHNGKLL